MRLRGDVVLPIVIVPSMIFVASLGPVWTIASFVGLPLVFIFFYTKCNLLLLSPGIKRATMGININNRSSFFVVWALSSLVFLEGVMEIEVLPFLDILPSENFLLKCFLVVTLYCLYRVRGDPGVLEKSSIGTSSVDSGLVVDNTQKLSRVIYDGDVENARCCSICDVLQVGRAGHCHTCNVCILRRDHHCVWIDTCIGASNHRSFIVGLFFLILTIWYGCHLTLTTICQPVLVFDLFLFPQDCSGVYENIHLAVCFVSAVYGLVILLLTTVFLLHQLYLISKNLTNPEYRQLKRNCQKGSPFSKGLLRNWHRFWCGPR